MIVRIAICLAVLVGADAHAQSLDIPRAADGRPDFHGVWESRWRTPLERPKEAEGPIVPADKADALIAAMDASSKASGNLSPDSDFDFGTLMPAAGGGFRTSLIVEPLDGKRPLNQAAQDWAKVVKERRDSAEGPEARGLAERCVSGPGRAPLQISPGSMYRQIIQTPQNAVIMTEDINDIRIIDMGGRLRPDALVSWTGDSSGRWEGDVLVIETRLLRPEPDRPPAPGGSPSRKVIERLQFNSANELGYSYTIDDPAMFVAPMRVDFTLIRSGQRMFESACHEGNYGLANILSGARETERRAAASKAATAH
jgi:hypothetical protein